MRPMRPMHMTATMSTVLVTTALVATALVATALPSPAAAQSLLEKLKGAVGTTSTEQTTTGTSGAVGAALSTDDIVAGLREALKVGSERVVTQIGGADGYNTDPDIHIPLPPALQDVQTFIRKFGLSGLADEVELKLNRAAEAAAPKTKDLIFKAITDMTLDDARAIYDGPEDAATQYFKRTQSDALADVVRPIVDTTLNEVGAIAAYDKLIGEYDALPLVPDVKADLTAHTVRLALEGLFHYLAKEEAAIRANPAKRTTEILSRVFGG